MKIKTPFFRRRFIKKTALIAGAGMSLLLLPSRANDIRRG